MEKYYKPKSGGEAFTRVSKKVGGGGGGGGAPPPPPPPHASSAYVDAHTNAAFLRDHNHIVWYKITSSEQPFLL